MSGVSKLNTTGMRSVADDIAQLAREYTQQVASLYTVGQELDATWDGDASRKFIAKLGQDQPRFEALNTVIIEYDNALRIYANSYDENEIKNLEILESNKVRQTK